MNEQLDIDINNEQNEEVKEKGASLVEYALLIALISTVAIVAINTIGQKVSQQFSTVASRLG
jgi:Flp pilus assembly pilin Flp